MTSTSDALPAVPLTSGRGTGEILRLTEPLSFWGGVDPATGSVIDAHHPQHDANIAGRVVVLEAVRGSNAGGSVLLECIRSETAPAVIVLRWPTQILPIGVIVGEELYHASLPIVTVESIDHAVLRPGNRVTVQADEEAATIIPL